MELLKKLCKIGAVCTGFTNSQKRDIIQTGEFGAEGLGGDIAEDVKGYEHLNALVTKPGAESKIVEVCSFLYLFDILLPLSSSLSEGHNLGLLGSSF